jgi:type IV pilus assembly protein PilX
VPTRYSPIDTSDRDGLSKIRHLARSPDHQPLAARGVALPVALILLVVLSLGGVLASRRAAGLEEVTNNARLAQAAHLAALSGLRFCESVVIDIVDRGGATHGALAPRLGGAVLTGGGDPAALWPALATWRAGAPNRIDVPVASQGASAALARMPGPQCLAEPMTQGRYLITARGLSANASFAANGQLLTGAEIWLQSVISPNVPAPSATGCFE